MLSGQFDRQELLRRLRFVKPVSSFRGGFEYQNIMYLAAGLALIKASGDTSWGDFIEKRIFSRLGMRESNTSVRSLEGRPDVAEPHARIDDTVRAIPYRNVDAISPAGAINSNVLDMAQWVRFQLNGGKVDGNPLLGPKAFQETRTPQSLRSLNETAGDSARRHFAAYGMGWFLEDYRGHFVVQHGGNIDGMTAFVGFMPDDQVGVVVLSNMNASPVPSAIGCDVFDRFVGGPAIDRIPRMAKAREDGLRRARESREKLEAARIKGTSPSLDASQYAGTYADSANGVLTVAMERGNPVVRYGPTFTGDLRHWHYDTYRVHWRASPFLQEGFVVFTLDSMGQVFQVTVEPFGVFGRVRTPGRRDRVGTR
jgi:CubicO group peptidase (beta-lactamase class C family)